MNTATRLSILSAAIVLAASLVGCGGGGGGGSSTSTLNLKITEPTLTGKTGGTVSVPVSVSGSGTVQTAIFDITFNSGVFEPASGITIGGSSAAISGTSDNEVARYKWVDAQTVRVVYASSTGVSSGNILLNIPLKVKAETTSGLTVESEQINK
ncbi:MAG: cohesin domain-containing protein [Armatimonadota bacterium]|nr:hypothetical protein [bacterium]